MKEGLVSIITPAYNASKYIKETINSVLNQTYKEWEMIIVNDGSTDNTKEIVKSFKDDRIKLINQQNMGVSVARNRALDEAKGEFITFLDADDILPERSLEVRIKYLNEYKDVDLVDGRILIKDAKLKSILRRYQPYYNGLLLPKLLGLDDRVFFNVCYFFKSSKVNKQRFKNMSHAEDLLFFIELSVKSKIKYAYVNENIYEYRTEHGSAMDNLKGLERGYIKLLREIQKLDTIKKLVFLKLKIKISKIMFLSWLSNKKFLNAFFSIKNILLA